MDSAIQSALELIGLSLAPGDDSRRALLEAAAKKVSDWESLWRLACDRHVAPLLYARLGPAGLRELIPSEIRDRLHVLSLQTAALNALRLHQMQKVSSLLRERGVRALYIKGASLILAGDYSHPGLRMFSDVDLLVEPAHQAEVRRAFAEAGEWRELPPNSARDTDQTRWLNRWRTLVEIHWRLSSFNGVPGQVGEQRLWERAEEVQSRGTLAWVPCREDRFILAAVHGTARHSFDSSLLFMTLADLAHLAGGDTIGMVSPTPRMDWGTMVEALKRERMLEHAALAAELAWELTRFPPLAEGLQAMRGLEPGLKGVTGPLVKPLLRMVRKPWVFSSRAETKLLTDKRPRVRARILGYALFDKLFPGTRKSFSLPEEAVEVKVVPMAGRYQRKLWDWDFIVYLLQLSRFYRRIGYTGMD